MANTQAAQLRELLQRFNTAILVTHGAGDRLRARPMAIARLEDNCDLWFVTSRETAKVHEIQSNRAVHVICQEGEKACASISGRAELVEDRGKLEEVWKESFKVWFPNGKDDPEICLIFVRGEEAEYWDTTGAKGLRYVFSAARAYVAGERPRVEEGKQHGNVKFSTV